jgi:hypothetical protein
MKVNLAFFGMMYQGSSVDAAGNVRAPYYDIPVGVQRLWDTAATLTFMGAEPPFNMSGFESQRALTNHTGAALMFTFGFSADPAYPPPAVALRTGSRNRPSPAFLQAATDAILDFDQFRFYELGNEYALKREYWDGTAEEAHQQSAWLYARIKARYPSAICLCPSLSDLLEPSGYAYAERYCALIRKQAACDAVAFHMYAKSVADIHAQLARLDMLGIELPLYCTEYDGPWEAFDIFAARGVKCTVLNGQQPFAPYTDKVMSERWISMVSRMITIGVNEPAPSTRSGCGRWLPWL